MRVCITTTNRDVGDHIYDLLTDPLSGHGCLKGTKKCIDEHNMVPDIMEFDLSHDEIEAVKKINGVVRVDFSGLGKPSIHYSKVRTPDATFRSANYTYSDNIATAEFLRTSPTAAGINLAPQHLYYSTNYDLKYTQNDSFTTTAATSALSIDCQNVDILILDTGVDPSCEDLKDIYGNDLVQQFDWSQVIDALAFPNSIVNILASDGYTGMAKNYYVDYIGHGTKCASTIAGFKCGLAKNAKIYCLNSTDLKAPYGFKTSTCLKLALGFLLGKLNGWYGLDPNRPTVFSNSWGVTGPVFAGYIGPAIVNTSGNVGSAKIGPIGVPSGLSSPTSPLNNINNIDGNDNDGLFAASVGFGGSKLNSNIGLNWCTSLPFFTKNASGAPYLNTFSVYDSVSDGYFRTLVANGMHCVLSAGNENIELNQQNPTLAPILWFQAVDGTLYSILRQMVLGSSGVYEDNQKNLALGSSYVINNSTYTLVASGVTPINYASPDIGPGADRNAFPIIKVGCVTPLGTGGDAAASTYDTGGYGRAIYDVLANQPLAPSGLLGGCLDLHNLNGGWYYLNYSGPPLPPIGVLYNDGYNNTNLRYGWNGSTLKLDTPMFVKSPYSNFGQSVDIYAVGSANWAGLSNQAQIQGDSQYYTTNGVFYSLTGLMSATKSAPYFKDNSSTYGAGYKGKFVFSNGTSSSCPAVAGCLATFLADNPKATPLEAKNWLIGASIKGNIMTTARTPFLSSLSGVSTTSGAGMYGVTFDGVNVTSINFGSLGIVRGLPSPYNNTFDLNASTITSFCAGFFTLRNNTYHPQLSSYFDIFNKSSYATWQYGISQMYDILFGCRFFSDSNNRVAQAHPLRKSVYYATTNTSYASAIYLNKNSVNVAGTKLYIGSASTQKVTHFPSEYVTSP